MAIFLCFLLLTFLSLITFVRKIKETKTLMKLPPSPPTLPIIGNLHQLAGLPHRCFHHLSIKYGPVVLLHLGFVPTVIISSSEAAEEVLRTNDLGCCSRPETVATGKLSYGFKDISFAQYGEYWREMRKLAVIELFSLKKVHSFKNIREEEVGFMVKQVSESTLKHSPVDLSKTFFSLTASIICRVALGQNFNESGFVIEQDRIEELVREASVALGTVTCSDFFPGGLGRFLDWLFGGHKKINKVFEELDSFYQHVIEDHLKPGEAGRKAVDSTADIVALLLDMMEKQGKKDYFMLNISDIKGVLMDIFLAGVDTGAITMIWAMTELVRNPNVMKKAQEEIRTTLGPNKEKITEEDSDKVGYLKLIIKETFRLHPAVPLLLPRETMSHVKINGYDIPPKTQIHLNVWAIGRDPMRWTDAEDFIPERFANSSVDFRGQHFDLLPFGSGRRSCPGMPMAIASVELGLLSLLYFFDWTLPEEVVSEEHIDMEEAGNLTVVKKQPLLLVPVIHHCPPSLPIIGNLHQLAGLPHRCFHHLSIKYGPVVLLHLGFVPAVIISSSEAAEEVLRIHDLGCCNRPKTVATGKLSYGFKDISFAQYGEYWREMRKLAVIELFSLKKVHSFKNIREEEVGFMVKKVSESALKHSPVDLSKTFFSLTASIICRVALGQNFNESGFVIEQDRIEELVREALVALGTVTCSDFFPGGLGRFLDWLFGGHKKINKVFEELDSFYQHVIEDHLKPGETGRKAVDSTADIVALLLDMMEKQGKKDYLKLNISDIKGVLMDIFLAGVDTGAITMIWAMTELVRNPNVMKKAQEEIRTTLGPNKEKITEEDVDKVGYLKLIIKETFRLHPAVPLLLPRETMSHVKINGYDIPPKTQIHLNVWAIGRDPMRWTDPEEFIPERFANSSVDFRGQHFDLLPFGSGRRSCPGMPMAIASVELGLLSLLYFFDWTLPEEVVSEEDIDMEEAGNLTVVKKQPLLLVPVRHH
ncbi:hypothetical protein Bca52824_094332 [Brassica carinata]|uniref:Cytochrome P450 71B2 n=1 Tax=Brassica carinata TaxID=52824 RepID=A0A8X7P3S9_BRACI|nr:hypothetical protein Bca52824_094332 [Brassica carinata]